MHRFYSGFQKKIINKVGKAFHQLTTNDMNRMLIVMSIDLQFG